MIPLEWDTTLFFLTAAPVMVPLVVAAVRECRAHLGRDESGEQEHQGAAPSVPTVRASALVGCRDEWVALTHTNAGELCEHIGVLMSAHDVMILSDHGAVEKALLYVRDRTGVRAVMVERDHPVEVHGHVSEVAA
ncbi:hypothetical protein [Kocuria sp.]|uniref:hypothetical protein n=1 Tax=Kocuria sp. TaxID=1871328 RepID=UPI0026DF9A2F|nr:hypothetical protein [Kocuria sp.]MDO5619304.1 hypothetical protein [Kocuria sp.]